MRKSLKMALQRRLFEHLIHNNLDLVINLQQKSGLNAYLTERIDDLEPVVKQWSDQDIPAHILEEKCLEVLTKALKPSRFHYIRSVLETEFRNAYLQLRESGTLTFEIVELIDTCSPVFEALGFSQANEHDPQLRSAIIRETGKYLEKYRRAQFTPPRS